MWKITYREKRKNRWETKKVLWKMSVRWYTGVHYFSDMLQLVLINRSRARSAARKILKSFLSDKEKIFGVCSQAQIMYFNHLHLDSNISPIFLQRRFSRLLFKKKKGNSFLLCCKKVFLKRKCTFCGQWILDTGFFSRNLLNKLKSIRQTLLYTFCRALCLGY